MLSLGKLHFLTENRLKHERHNKTFWAKYNVFIVKHIIFLSPIPLLHFIYTILWAQYIFFIANL